MNRWHYKLALGISIAVMVCSAVVWQQGSLQKLFVQATSGGLPANFGELNSKDLVTYQVKLNLKGQPGNSAVSTSLAGSDSASQTQLEGHLEQWVIPDRPGTTVGMRLKVDRFELEINDSKDSALANAVEAELEIPWLVDFDQRRQIKGIHLSPRLGHISKSIVRYLLSSLQVSLPTEEEQQSWQVTETDAMGKYFAAYQVEGVNGAFVQLSKKKTSYVEHDQQMGEEVGIQVVASPTTITWDTKHGILSKLELTENIALRQGKNLITANYLNVNIMFDSLRHLTSLDIDTRQDMLASLPKGLQLSDLSGTQEILELRKSAQQKILGDNDAQSLLAAANQEIKSYQDITTELYRRFKALIYLHPEESATLADAIKDMPIDHPTFAAITLALQSVGHDKAQQALIAIMDHRSSDTSALEQLLPTLAMTQHPNLNSEAYVRTLTNSENADIAHSALLSLGIIGGRIKNDPDHDRFSLIVAELVARYNEAKSDPERSLHMAALGNIGHSDQTQLVQADLQQENEELNATALRSLRFVDTEAAEGIIIERLKMSYPVSQREAAASTLAFRKPSLALNNAVSSSLRQEQSQEVIKQAIAYFSRTAWQNDQAVTELTWAKEHLREETLRLAATNALLAM